MIIRNIPYSTAHIEREEMVGREFNNVQCERRVQLRGNSIQSIGDLNFLDVGLQPEICQ
jgi:hypothetical protein